MWYNTGWRPFPLPKGGTTLTWLSDSFKEFFRKGDLLLLSLCLAASAFGMALIYSATRYLHSNRYVLVQAVAILLGVLVYIIMSSVDIELFTDRSWKFLLAFNILFILALVPFGTGAETTGNQSWIPLPVIPVNVQPAEVAKLSFVLLLAWQIGHLSGRGISRPSSVLWIGGHTVLMCGIIAAVSGDFGMCLTYLMIFVIMAWSGGVQKRWFLLALILGVAAVLLIWPHIRDMYFAKRFIVVFDHLVGNTDPDSLFDQTQGAGYQQTRSILAIGSGGLTGQGFLQGIQTQSASSQSIIARYTDEIFAVCGEEFGLLGCCGLLLLLAAIIVRCFWVARRACSLQSALIAAGYGGMLLVQVGVNVGMCLYVFPVVGLTLPFISYGGSSIITMFAAMGVVSGIKTRSLPSWLRDRSQL